MKKNQDLLSQWKRQDQRSLSMGDPLLTWFLQCWDIVANVVAPDNREAKQLGSLSWDAGIDQEIRRRPETFILCRQLLSSARERYPCKDELLVQRVEQHGTRYLVP